MGNFYLYKFSQFILRRLPLAVCYRVAEFLADIHRLSSRADRRAVTNNISSIVTDPAAVAPAVRDVFRNFARYLVEFLKPDTVIDEQYVRDHITVKNLDVLRAVSAEGRGGILLTAHLGNWELGGLILGALGYPLRVIALPHKDRAVNDLFNQLRARKGMTVTPTSIAVRRCLEDLHQNKLIALLADRDFSQNGEVLSFLGKKALIPKGAAIFSLKTGAPIIPMFLVREADEHFTLFVEPPIYPPKPTADDDGVLTVMRRYVAVIDRMIRAYPSQWLMFREYGVPE